MNNGDPAPVRSVTALEKHLSEKITSVETSLSGKINLVEANLSTRIDGIEKLFASENRAAKEAVSIAMTAAEKAGGKFFLKLLNARAAGRQFRVQPLGPAVALFQLRRQFAMLPAQIRQIPLGFFQPTVLPPQLAFE